MNFEVFGVHWVEILMRRWVDGYEDQKSSLSRSYGFQNDHDVCTGVLILDLSGKLYENVKKADEKTLSGTNNEGLDTLKVDLNENFLRIFF